MTRILYGYSYYASEAYGDVAEMNRVYLERLRHAGFDVEGFCLTLQPPGPCLTFRELDGMWRRRERSLMEMYERLEAALDGKDALLNASGINLHPELVERLAVFTAFQCYDDPENSINLSRPAATAYDLCLVGNIAELDTYRRWGCREVEWSPLGLQPDIYDHSLTAEKILDGERDIDLFMMADRTSRWRKKRLDQLAAAFPDAHFYGKGWPRGFLPSKDERAYLQRAKIGPNLHNSTGPINYRTFYLPANGVLQVCDNKSHLGEIYQLGKQVVGFDTASECIDLCHYYLSHDRERREIAAAGWKRAITDYNEVALFGRVVAAIEKRLYPKRQNGRASARPLGLRDQLAQRFPAAYDSFGRALYGGRLLEQKAREWLKR
jgi:hypothetical protein